MTKYYFSATLRAYGEVEADNPAQAESKVADFIEVYGDSLNDTGVDDVEYVTIYDPADEYRIVN